MTKRTKIICTIGPASASVSTLAAMMRAGMNMARINFSHSDYKHHQKLLAAIRAAAKKTRTPIEIIGDLQGPKIRLGILPVKGVVLKKGGSVRLGIRLGETLPLSHDLSHDVKVGHRILIDDGRIELTVVGVEAGTITGKVVTGGKVTSHKGVNVPDSKLSLGAITDKDRADLAFALKEKIPWIALSFVTSAQELEALRQLVKGKAKIIAKIEKPEALKNINAIIKVSDAIMIARGDLGIETPMADVPLVQKQIIKKCHRAGKPVIVATQILESMVTNPRPTRAEVSDVANAVLDGATHLMLSEETAIGKYPVAAVNIMAQICHEAEHL